MIVVHNGRKITAIAKCKDGFPGVLVRVSGIQVWHYSWSSSEHLRTIEGAIKQTKLEIDAIDAYTDDADDPRFGSHWYAKSDPRRALALRRENG